MTEVEELQRVAEKGDANAQFHLAVRFDQGQGVPQDYAEAAAWFRRTAEQGPARAEFNLGLMYYEGDGVLQAASWYRRAAEQGHADAQFGLGRLHYRGEGVSQDVAEAWQRMTSVGRVL